MPARPSRPRVTSASLPSSSQFSLHTPVEPPGAAPSPPLPVPHNSGASQDAYIPSHAPPPPDFASAAPPPPPPPPPQNLYYPSSPSPLQHQAHSPESHFQPPLPLPLPQFQPPPPAQFQEQQYSGQQYYTPLQQQQQSPTATQYPEQQLYQQPQQSPTATQYPEQQLYQQPQQSPTATQYPQQQLYQQHQHVSPPASPGAMSVPQQQESYQLQPTGTPAPQPARSPPPPFDYPHQGGPSPAVSPPPAFDPVLHAPQQQFSPPPQQEFAPPPQQEFAPPPQQEFAPPPQQEFAPPPQQEFAPPPQQQNPEQNYPYDANGFQQPPQVQAPVYREDTMVPKTPIYTPGGAAGPNGGVHAPGQIGHPNLQHGKETYHHGLCDCFSDIGTCCTGCWCPCILYSKTYHRLKTVPNSTTADFNACNAPCAMWCLLSPVAWIFTTLQRNRIRENYRLEGSIAGDCCKAYCCVACTLVQDDREVAHREEERRRFAGPGSGAVGEPGYRRASGMVYG